MNKRLRFQHADFTTREDDGAKFIEGYFAVFNSVYQIGPGMAETIDAHAFDGTMDDDIRALINHDTTLVIGRTKAGTLELRADDHGLWGRVLINPNDQDALNVYARVARGDVSQCSIGFDILNEDTEVSGQDVHWTIKEIRLYEVSICTFPAYEETEIQARKNEGETLKKRELEHWKARMSAKLKGEKDA